MTPKEREEQVLETREACRLLKSPDEAVREPAVRLLATVMTRSEIPGERELAQQVLDRHMSRHREDFNQLLGRFGASVSPPPESVQPNPPARPVRELLLSAAVGAEWRDHPVCPYEKQAAEREAASRLADMISVCSFVWPKSSE